MITAMMNFSQPGEAKKVRNFERAGASRKVLYNSDIFPKFIVVKQSVTCGPMKIKVFYQQQEVRRKPSMKRTTPQIGIDQGNLP
ncbi:MAG: hypothetical protein L3J67_03940 [Hyphomicrobiaceae bacterium]|nr:hypothetical protein [Hyphomicrobiaceae bacterium]